jgi:hypothetical protein
MTLLSEASFLVTPNGYKASKLYAAIPTNGNGDMTFTRATTATRVDENDLVSSVASNVPRIDYTGGGCPSILLEPQSTNIVLRSEEFDNASFTPVLSSVSANTTTAPDGTLTADTWTGDGTSGIHLLGQSLSATSGVAYTQSVFAKKGTNNFLQIVGTTTIYGANSWANFDLENGVVGTAGASATATITDFGNGWYRCTMTATATATATANGFLLCLITSATSARAEINSLATSVHLWGAQLEAGAYPTSYIPTTNIAVQRDADAVVKTGISDLINSEEGVLFVEFKTLSETGTFRQFNLSKDSGNRIYITKRGDSGNLEFRMSNPSGNLNFSFAENTTNDFVKVAFRYGLNNFAVFIDGVNKNVTSTGNVFASGTLNTLEFDSPLSQPFFGKVKQLALFPTPLSDPQCIALTTL